MQIECDSCGEDFEIDDADGREAIENNYTLLCPECEDMDDDEDDLDDE